MIKIGVIFIDHFITCEIFKITTCNWESSYPENLKCILSLSASEKIASKKMLLKFKKLNKLVSADIKHLSNWLNANKISLNVKKTEMVIFKSKQKKFEGDLKIKFCGKRLYLLKVLNT